MKLARAFRSAPIAVLAILALSAAAFADTVANGSKILTVTHKGVNSATLTPGTDFKLHVDDPSQPALAGAMIVGHVTSVAGPAGLTRASIAFVFDYIRVQERKERTVPCVRREPQRHADEHGAEPVRNRSSSRCRR